MPVMTKEFVASAAPPTSLGALGTTPIPAEALVQLFERLPLGLVLSDTRGRPLGCNRAARELLEQIPGGHRLCAELVAKALRRGAPAASALTGESRSAWALATAEQAGGVMSGASEPRWVAILLIDPCGALVDASLIGELCGLTPAESETAAMILTGSPPKQIARVLGISVATVKTHLHRVFGKTGTKGQADLARRLARAIPPMTLLAPMATAPVRTRPVVAPARALAREALEVAL